MSLIDLTSEQLAQLIVLRSNKEHSAMYSFLHKIVIDKVAVSPKELLVHEWKKQLAKVVSDGLAQSIAHTVLETGGIPGVQELIEADINATVQGFKLERWHWPGTLYDQLPYPFGWGQDFVQVTGNTRMEYLKNMGVALMQTVAGLNRYLDRDTLLDKVPHWKMARDANSWVDDNLYRLFPETFVPAAEQIKVK